MIKKKSAFETFCETIHTLRSDNGCPWDKKQTSNSLKKYIQEETRELLEAIDEEDSEHICEEAGDILFLIALLTEIHQENNAFSMEDVLNTITAKMIRRHPHVFSGKEAGDEAELRAQWEQIKSLEQTKKIN